jgi:MFS family permease
MISAEKEWAAMWPLPIVAMLGIAGCAAFAFSNGIFLGEMTCAFGWSRAQFSSAFTVQMLTGLILAPLVGACIERFGPRRIALTAILPYALSLSLLGLADGSIGQWRVLCALQGIAAAFVGPPVWITAVIRRFDASRGLALAVSLAGIGVAAMIWPLIAAFCLQRLGWRPAFAAMAFSWAIPMLPLTFSCFYAEGDEKGSAASSRPSPSLQPSLAVLLRSRTFLYLLVAGGLFSSITLGLGLHLVPLLRENGLALTRAATVASTYGAATLVGRIGTGFLLDRLPARYVGVSAFLLPVVVSMLLLQRSSSLAVSFAAAILFGLATGAETDIVTYLISRRLSSSFASAYAVVNSVFAVCASLGPLIAGALFDLRGSYRLYLLAIAPTVTVSAWLIWLVPNTPERSLTGPRE